MNKITKTQQVRMNRNAARELARMEAEDRKREEEQAARDELIAELISEGHLNRAELMAA